MAEEIRVLTEYSIDEDAKLYHADVWNVKNGLPGEIVGVAFKGGEMMESGIQALKRTLSDQGISLKDLKKLPIEDYMNGFYLDLRPRAGIDHDG